LAPAFENGPRRNRELSARNDDGRRQGPDFHTEKAMKPHRTAPSNDHPSLPEYYENFFRPIPPEEYEDYGIDPKDVPMGTFAARDHPSFLPSRFGGNAYGLGLMELRFLGPDDSRFLESLDFKEPRKLGRHARQLNRIHQRLGLLIRFASTGLRYFLIPITLVAHSLKDIRIKADQIETLVQQHFRETRTERLNIGLMTPAHDIIVHELTARLSTHRIFLFESLEKLRRWRTPLDLIILPSEFSEFFLEYQIHEVRGKSWTQERFLHYAGYLSGKIYELLEPQGKFIVLTHSFDTGKTQTCRVHFKSEKERKAFLLFSHVFKTSKKYDSETTRESADIHLPDLCCYLNRFNLLDSNVKRLLKHRNPEELGIREIDELHHLDLCLPEAYVDDQRNQLKAILDAYFHIAFLEKQSLKHFHKDWEDRLELDRDLPESLLLLVGKPRSPSVTLGQLDEEIKASGMMGCSLPLVAEYRDTFQYVLRVLEILENIKGKGCSLLPELERNRLSGPFDWPSGRSRRMDAISSLLALRPRLEQLHQSLNPDGIEGPTTPILENIPKMSLHGFDETQLREILLIVVGHSSMSRIVFGKLPAKTLTPITRKGRKDGSREVLDLLRVCRLMSLAEMAGSLGKGFTSAHARELFGIYRNAIDVATHPDLDWDKLHDLHISDLGGVRNKAVREMMKFFNLFEFLDNWREFKQKGPCQKEVLCDYEPQILEQLDEATELVRIATRFDRRFLGEHAFGNTYFFHQFLDTEFHGTGHLFPGLGPRAGFVLLWIAVNLADKRIINFNPILSKIPQERRESRIGKIKDVLLGISMDDLRPQWLQQIRKTLDEQGPAFILDSGVRLLDNPQTRAVDVSFVDLEENLEQIDRLLAHFERTALRQTPLKDFQETERYFSELESYHRYLGKRLEIQQESRAEDNSFRDLSAAVIDTLEDVRNRLRSIFLSQVLVPGETYDALSVMASHCPEILRFILPEFHALGNLMENWPTRQKQSLGAYAMRCLRKFQALTTRNRDGFQDRNVFYRLAKKELGALAEEGVGASHPQMEALENMVHRVRQETDLYQALTLALVFQDIGKIERYLQAAPRSCVYCTHAEQGAAILDESDILDKYRLSPRVRRRLVSLVSRHGLIGHVIQGEEPVVRLEALLKEGDDRMLDACVLHSILAAAAVQEGLMTSDLVDAFLEYRGAALQTLKSGSGWRCRLEEHLREKGQAILEQAESIEGHSPGRDSLNMVCSGNEPGHCYFSDESPEDEALWRGRQIAAFERLMRLMGLPWVDYQDLQMHLLNLPPNFIFHKKGLKGVGQQTFRRQLETAKELFHAITSMRAKGCNYILYCLDTLGGAFRIYDFYPVVPFLSLDESLKLLLLSFRVFHFHFGRDMKGGLVSFRPLGQKIERRHQAFRHALHRVPYLESCPNEEELSLFLQEERGLTFEASLFEKAVGVDFDDAIPLERMIRSMEEKRTHEELSVAYHQGLRQLQELPFETRKEQEALTAAFRERRKKINDTIVRDFGATLSRVNGFPELKKAQESMEKTRWDLGFSQEQQLLVKEMFDYHRTRLRSDYLDGIHRRINEAGSRRELLDYWNALKYELLSYRSYVGKEYESLIARHLDRKLGEM